MLVVVRELAVGEEGRVQLLPVVSLRTPLPALVDAITRPDLETEILGLDKAQRVPVHHSATHLVAVSGELVNEQTQFASGLDIDSHRSCVDGTRDPRETRCFPRVNLTDGATARLEAAAICRSDAAQRPERVPLSQWRLARRHRRAAADGEGRTDRATNIRSEAV